MRYWWLAWWQARRYSLLASMTYRRYSSAGISNGTPRTRLGGPGMWAGHPQRGSLTVCRASSRSWSRMNRWATNLRRATLPPVPTSERLSFAVDQFTGSGQYVDDDPPGGSGG